MFSNYAKEDFIKSRFLFSAVCKSLNNVLFVRSHSSCSTHFVEKSVSQSR